MKNSKIKYGLIALLSFVIVSCKVEPQAIEYGNDVCSYCKMNIVQKTHSAQYVTKKGKQFKFDAVECLVHAVSETDVNAIALFLVADYNNPGTMIYTHEATFLISPGIKSPMGANLTAISSKEKAKELQLKHTGELFSWDALVDKLADKK